MSFFGQNNQQNSGFGGFGSNNNSGTGKFLERCAFARFALYIRNIAFDANEICRHLGFGQPSNTGFGASSGATTGGGLFGTSNNNNSSGFGGM